MGADSTRAPDGATTFTTKDDAALIAAWDRRTAAFTALQELPDNPRAGSDGETPERLAQWAIVDAAEAEIRASVACTPRGAELQLWVAATYIFDSIDNEAPLYRADLDYLAGKDDGGDWSDRFIIAAIRSLRAMGGVK